MGNGPDDARERLNRMVASAGLLAEVSRTLGPGGTLDETVASVLDAMQRLVKFRGGSICLVDDGMLRVAAADPAPSDEVLALRLPVGSGLAGRAVGDRMTVYSPDLDHDERVDPDVRRTGSNAGITSYLAVPLICLGSAIGVLQVDSPDEDAFDDADILLLEGLAAQAASVIESARHLEEVQRVEELKRGFINLVSHELRTPLTIATGMLTTARHMEGSTEPDDERIRQDLLDRGEKALGRLGRLIEELIMMSQLAAGELVSEPEAVDLAPLVAQVRDRAPDPSVVTVSCPDDAVVHTDGRILGRVLEAMVENAVLYAGDAEIVVDAHVIEVRDHGPGIPEDVQHRERPAFSRAKSNDTTIAGLGLGFAMTNALLAEIGGELEIETAPGEGTVVRIICPT